MWLKRSRAPQSPRLRCQLGTAPAPWGAIPAAELSCSQVQNHHKCPLRLQDLPELLEE